MRGRARLLDRAGDAVRSVLDEYKGTINFPESDLELVPEPCPWWRVASTAATTGGTRNEGESGSEGKGESEGEGERDGQRDRAEGMARAGGTARVRRPEQDGQSKTARARRPEREQEGGRGRGDDDDVMFPSKA